MLVQQLLGSRPQNLLAQTKLQLPAHRKNAGLLGNPEIQSVIIGREHIREVKNNEKTRPLLFIAPVSNGSLSSARLEALKKQKFTPADKQERIAKALAALSQGTTINLPKEVWRQIAEDPDLEDQF